MVMTWFIIILMVGGIFGVVFFGFGSGASPRVNDQGLEFTDRGSHWTTRINNIEVPFSYLPSQVSHIPLDALAANLLRGKLQIDVTSDFNNTFADQIALANFQMADTVVLLNVFTRTGFTSESGTTLPIITCKDASSAVPVIYYRTGNQTQIYVDGNCIIAEMISSSDAVQLKDRMVYGMTGILQ